MRKLGPTLIALPLAVALPSTEYAKGAQRGAIEGAERVAEAGGPQVPRWEAGQGESSVKELDCWTSISGRVSVNT